MRKKRSLIWKIDTIELTNIVQKSNTITAILNHFGLRNIGGNHKTIKKRLNADQIDFTHIISGLGHRKNKIIGPKLSSEQAIEKYFKLFNKLENHHSNSVKFYLKKYNLISYICKQCDNNGIHNNKPLSLQLHHKDGQHNNNLLNNLEWLCPNCHSQTFNYAGRYTDKIKIKKDPTWRNKPRLKMRKVERPSKDVLEHEIKSIPFTTLGKKYGVSDNAIRKWCKSYSICCS